MADINTGSTGSGRPASEPLIAGHLASRAAGSGPSGGAFGESSQELEGFIRTATKGKSAVSELLGMLSGDGKTRVSNFTGAIKSLNTELKRSVDLLKEAREHGGNLPAGLGGGSSGGIGGDYKMPDAASAADDHARDTGGGGGGGGRTAPTPNGGRGVAVGQAAMALGGVALLGAGRSFTNRLEGATFLDTLTRQQMVAGGGNQGSWSAQYADIFRNTAIGGFEGMAAADASLRGGGIGRGSAGYTSMMQQVGNVRHAMPGADVGQLASGAASLQHGAVAMGLRQRGITSFTDDYATQMRKVMKAAMGGKQPTQELMALIRPGTIYYDNLMAILGDDPQLVADVIDFNRADARGRTAGVDVTTRAGATAIGYGDRSIEGRSAYAAGEKAAYGVADQMENLNKQATEMYRNMERANEWLEKLPESFKNLWNQTGQLVTGFSQFTGTSGLGGLLGPALTGYLAGGGRFAGMRRAAGRVLGRGGGTAATTVAGEAGEEVAGRVARRSAVRTVARTAARTAAPAVAAYGTYKGLEYLSARAAGYESVEEERAANAHLQDPDAWAEAVSENYLSRPDQGETNSKGEVYAGPSAGWVDRATYEKYFAGAEPRGGLVRGADHDGEGVSRRGFGGVKSHVAAAGNYLAQKFGPFPGGIGGVGKRSNKSDHPAGLALDFMTNNNTSLGDRLVSYLTKNAKHFGVKYIIWKQRINSGSGWRKMADRGSPTANHMDHPHVSFHSSPESGQEFSDEGGFGSDTGGTEEAAASAISRLTGGFGGRNELDIFNSFFGGAGRRSSSSGSAANSALGTGDSDPVFGSYGGGQGQLSDTELMQVLQQAGFSGQGLITAFAIARAESGGNSKAFNGNASTGDKSYGLFQINMLDKMGPARRKAYGLSSNEDLYDPVTNARVAYAMSRGGTKWSDWSVHPSSKGRGAKGSGYEQYLDDARAAFSGAGAAEPRGGLETGGSDVGYVTPAAPPARSGGGAGVRDVNVTFKIERATYEEAEKFAGWVMGFIDQKDNLATIGGR